MPPSPSSCPARNKQGAPHGSGIPKNGKAECRTHAPTVTLSPWQSHTRSTPPRPRNGKCPPSPHTTPPPRWHTAGLPGRQRRSACPPGRTPRTTAPAPPSAAASSSRNCARRRNKATPCGTPGSGNRYPQPPARPPASSYRKPRAGTSHPPPGKARSPCRRTRNPSIRAAARHHAHGKPTPGCQQPNG